MWGEIGASYTAGEKQQMAELRAVGASADELATIHGLKAEFDAELREPTDAELALELLETT